MDSNLFLQQWLKRNKVRQPEVDQNALMANIMAQVSALPKPKHVEVEKEEELPFYQGFLASPWRRFALSIGAACALALLLFDFDKPVTPLPGIPTPTAVTLAVLPTPTVEPTQAPTGNVPVEPTATAPTTEPTTEPTKDPTETPRQETIRETIKNDAMLLAALGELDISMLPPSEKVLQRELEEIDDYYFNSEDENVEALSDDELQQELMIMEKVYKN